MDFYVTNFLCQRQPRSKLKSQKGFGKIQNILRDVTNIIISQALGAEKHHILTTGTWRMTIVVTVHTLDPYW